MRASVIVVAGCLSLIAGAEAQDIYRFGRLGLRLPAEDIAAIARSVAERGTPLAMLGWYSQTLPEVRYVDVFLPPTSLKQTIRRGPIARLKCSPHAHDSACIAWEESAAPGQYALVADSAAGFSEGYLPRTPRERPIRIVGDLSDDDIVTLVAYIRTSPRPRAERGSSTMALSGDLPILDIEREPDGVFRAWLTEDGGVVHSARFRHTRQGWQITEVVLGIA
jgi:hypothetical protein